MAFQRNSFSYQDQRGFTLLEALIAFVVLAGGLLAAFRFHSTTMETTAASKIRAQATALGEQKLEELRSFRTKGEFDTNVQAFSGVDDVDNRGLDGYSDVDYAATFTRSWTTAGINPKEVSVTVTWPDREGVTQTIQVASMIWKTDPAATGTQFASALTGDDPADGFVPRDPVNSGTDYGVGRVVVSEPYEAASLPDGSTHLNEVTHYYDITFEGSIEAIDAELLSVVLDGERNAGPASCEISGSPLSPTAVNYVAPNWLDSDGAVIDSPYIYTCNIIGIPDGETWTGNVTYTGTENNDAVCTPNQGTTELSFSQLSPESLQLGIVLVDRNGLCQQFN